MLQDKMMSLQTSKIKEILEKKFKKMKNYKMSIKNLMESPENDPDLIPNVQMVSLNQDTVTLKK